MLSSATSSNKFNIKKYNNNNNNKMKKKNNKNI